MISQTRIRNGHTKLYSAECSRNSLNVDYLNPRGREDLNQGNSVIHCANEESRNSNGMNV